MHCSAAAAAAATAAAARDLAAHAVALNAPSSLPCLPTRLPACLQAYLNVEAVKGVTRSITGEDANQVAALQGARPAGCPPSRVSHARRCLCMPACALQVLRCVPATARPLLLRPLPCACRNCLSTHLVCLQFVPVMGFECRGLDLVRA